MARESKRPVVAETAEHSTGQPDDLGAYTPRTPLGARLLEIRRRVVSSGAPLLDWDALEREIAERRGERKS